MINKKRGLNFFSNFRRIISQISDKEEPEAEHIVITVKDAMTQPNLNRKMPPPYLEEQSPW